MTDNQLNLTSRERDILRAVIQHFVLTATPVGSRQLARRQGLDLSPATIRNVMADLEEMGLLCHPHTSAGRVPSDLGYRLYVDGLMDNRELTVEERQAIQREFESAPPELDDLMTVTARVLSSASKLLAIVMIPALDEVVLDRIELVRLAEQRLLVVLSLESGPVKTIMVEIDHKLPDDQLRGTAQALNARLSGLTMAQVRKQIGERLLHAPAAHAGLVRFFVDSADRLFTFTDRDEVAIGGRAEMLAQPEFNDPRTMRGIIELIENKDIIVHLLQNQPADETVSISIGPENVDLRAKDLSVLTSTYHTATHSGKVGVIGPKRMDYSKLKSLVEFTARMIDRRLDSGTTLR